VPIVEAMLLVREYVEGMGSIEELEHPPQPPDLGVCDSSWLSEL